MNDDVNLGRLLGRREAFSAMAGRCSAAEAAQLKSIRDTKVYLNHAKGWEEFCATFLNVSHDSANRVIRLLEQFGSAYFKVAQLTRISPKAYRQIAPSIQGEALHHNGEIIPLNPENSQKVAAAVAEIRKAAEPARLPAPLSPPPEEPPLDPLPALEQECSAMLHRIEAVITMRLPHRQQLRAVVCAARDRLNRLELMV